MASSHARSPFAAAVARAYRRICEPLARFYAELERHRGWRVLAGTFEGWSDDRAGTMAAAIAFYTVWSLPATLVLVVWIAGLAFGDEAARAALVDQVSNLIGPKAGSAVGTIIGNASPTTVSPYTAVLGGVTLVLGATTVFNQIHQSLNVIWRADGKMPGGILQMLKTRVLSVSVVLSIGFLMLVSLAISAGTSAMADYITTLDKRFMYVVEGINTVLSLGLTFLLFGLIYKILPTVRIEWREVRLAALATAILFTAGKYVIALYIGRSNIASMFGAASVVIVIILWVYYSASIMLLGAEFSKAYSRAGRARGTTTA